MSGRYLIRFDDVCPTMNRTIWEGIEAILLEAGVRPILAVVPENVDPHLEVDDPMPDFWSRVRAWQARGWTIGLHGFRHQYVTGEAGLVGLQPRSEFAGLEEAEQRDKLEQAVAVFRREGVVPEVWVAPSHAFDQITLKCLRALGIDVSSDGLAPWPHRDAGGTLWVPAQMWRFRPMPFGVWTVCFHCNSWREADLEAFRRNVTQFRDQITDLEAVVAQYGTRRVHLRDQLAAGAMLQAIRLRQRLKAVRGRA